MPTSTTWLAIGVVAGVGIGVGAALLWQRTGGRTAAVSGRRRPANPPSGPAVTEHTVLRDQQGRIRTVQTIEGVGAVRGNGHHHPDQAPEMDEATGIHFD